MQLLTSTWFCRKYSSVRASCSGSSSTRRQYTSRPAKEGSSGSDTASSSAAGSTCTSATVSGSSIVKSQPCPTTLFKERFPPIKTVIFRVMDRPSPNPSAFSVAERRVNSPNIRSCSSGGIPGPESLTKTFSSALLSARALIDTTMTTRPSRVNLRAFDNKFPTI